MKTQYIIATLLIVGVISMTVMRRIKNGEY